MFATGTWAFLDSRCPSALEYLEDFERQERDFRAGQKLDSGGFAISPTRPSDGDGMASSTVQGEADIVLLVHIDKGGGSVSEKGELRFSEVSRTTAISMCHRGSGRRLGAAKVLTVAQEAARVKQKRDRDRGYMKLWKTRQLRLEG